jgi:hypothetical protein
MCDCVAYYMPRNADSMPICAPSKISCVELAIEEVQMSA